MAVAGRAAIVPEGEYNITTPYKRLSMVRYEGNSYVAKEDNTGVIPTNEEIWMLSTEGAGIATVERAGIVKPDGKTIRIEEDGKIVGTSSGFTGTMEEFEAASLAGEIEVGTVVNITDDYQETPNGNVIIDDMLSSTSENPVQNKVITEEMELINSNVKSLSQFSFKAERNQTIRFCTIKPIKSGQNLRFGIIVDFFPINFYDNIACGRVLITDAGCSEIIQSVDKNMVAYKKSIKVYKSNTDEKIYFYLSVPEYNDENVINVVYAFPYHPPYGVEFEVTNVSNWENEVADKTLLIDTYDNKSGELFLNGYRALNSSNVFEKIGEFNLGGTGEFNIIPNVPLNKFGALSLSVSYASAETKPLIDQKTVYDVSSIDPNKTVQVNFYDNNNSIGYVRIKDGKFACSGNSGFTVVAYGLYPI